MADRDLEVILRFLVDRTGVQQATGGAQQVRDALKRVEAQAKATQEQMNKWRETSERIGQVGQQVALLGAAISGPLLLTMRAYTQQAGQAEDASRRWLAATRSLTDAQMRVGRIATQAALPYLEKAADLAERAAKYAEQHPGAIEAALKAGAVITGIGAFVTIAAQGIKLVADVKYLAASAQQMAAAALMKKAADEQLTAAGKGLGGAAGKAIGAAGTLGAGGLAAVVAGGAAFQTSIWSGLFKGTDTLIDRLAGRNVYSSWDALNDVVKLVTGGLGKTGTAATEAAGALQQVSAGGMSARAQSAYAARYAGLAQTPENRRAQANAVIQATQAALAAQEALDQEYAEVKKQLAEQAAEAEITAARRAEDAIIAARRHEQDIARQTAQQRAQIARQYEQAISQAEQAYHQAREQAAQQFSDRQIEIERAYRNRLADIQREYEDSVWEASLNRDAAALLRAQRSRDEQTALAQRDKTDQSDQARRQYQEQLSQAEQARQQQLEAARQAREQALAELQESLRREQEEQRIAEQRRAEDERLAQQREQADRQRWLQQRYSQLYAAHQRELNETQAHLNQVVAAYQNAGARIAATASRYTSYVPTTPTKGARPRAYQAGGYAVGGLATLHAGEFVLNPETTRRLEVAVGGPLTQQSVGISRSVTLTVAPTFGASVSDPAAMTRAIEQVVVGALKQAGVL